jgi:transcriptional regulator with XRE-family HTH domain
MSDRLEFYRAGEDRAAAPLVYPITGLPPIYLLNGFTLKGDPDYGQLVEIHDKEGLHRAIALHILEGEGMTGPEFRFLRKMMGRTQAELARRFKVTEQTVANYEKGVTSIPGGTEEYMRVIGLLAVLPDDAKASVISALTEKVEAQRKTRRGVPKVVRKKISRWHETEPAMAA